MKMPPVFFIWEFNLKKMKNIVILSGELFVRICVCFDVVIHGYVSGIKKNILKRLLSLFIWFNRGSFHSLFNEKRLKKNNHERIELWNIAVKITFTLINLSV